MKSIVKILAWILSSVGSAVVVGGTAAAGFLIYESQDLPNVDEIMTTRLSVPMRVYSADNRLMYEFGKEKRDPVTYSDTCWNIVNEHYADVSDDSVMSPIQPVSESVVSEVAGSATAEATQTTTENNGNVNGDAAVEAVAGTPEKAVQVEPVEPVDCRRRMQLVQAFISAEDDRYFDHPGVDWEGLARAAKIAVQTGSVSQGGSTITMQLPRNVADVGLSRDQRISRKLKEIIVAFQLEQRYSKKSILERYLNVIYMGNSAYGVVTAAQRYYGKTLDELTLAQAAMLAGLPKAPGLYTPLSTRPEYVERALDRRNYVLRRMFELNYISGEEFDTAKQQSLTAGLQVQDEETKQLSAGYMAEMARLETIKMFGKGVDEYGLNVYTTVDSRLQNAANDAVFKGLLAYDKRHGYRGPVAQVKINPNDPDYAVWDDVLLEHQNIRDFVPAIVTNVNEQSFQAYVGVKQPVTVEWEQMQWARRWIPEDERTRRERRRGVDRGPELETAAEAVSIGDVVLLREIPATVVKNEATAATDDADEQAGEPMPETVWQLSQKPEAQSAFVAIHPQTGAIQALVGGIEFLPGQDEFNRAVQSLRQPGSAFKPFVYSAAVKFGYSPPTIINDAPVVLPGYKPNNANHKIDGPTTLRNALRLSKNLVAIRLVQAIARDEQYGFEYLVKHLERFGFDRSRMPRELGLALGTAQLAPVELASAYTVFATDGYRVPTYFIERIEDRKGNLLYQIGDVDLCAKPCRRDGYYEEEEIARTSGLSNDYGEEDLDLPELQEWLPPEDFQEPPSNRPAAMERATMAPPPVVLMEPVDAQRQARIEIQPRIQSPRLAPQVVEARNAFLMKSMMRSVVTGGTARAALTLDREDVYGKTGTTNDQRDAWFAGFNPELIGVAWVGFDKRRVLGRGEYGGDVALPIWLDFMKVALEDKPEIKLETPAGITGVRVNRKTGEPASKGERFAIWDYFPDERVPVEFVYQKEEEALRRQNPDEAPPDMNATELVQDIFGGAPAPDYVPPENNSTAPADDLWQTNPEYEPVPENKSEEQNINNPSVWR